MSARTLITTRLARKLWPLFRGTSFRRDIGPGDRLLFYQGGSAAGSQTIAGAARVKSIRQGKDVADVDPTWCLSTAPERLIELENVETFSRPVDIRPLIGRLTVLPEKSKKWGVRLMGGCRRLAKSDFDLILRKARRHKEA